MSDESSFNYLTKRALTLGSGCQLMFIRRTEEVNGTETSKIIPVLMLTGVNRFGSKENKDSEENKDLDGIRITTNIAQGCVGIVTTELNSLNKLITDVKNMIRINPSDGLNSDWITTLKHDKDTVVYPRIFIKSLQVKTNSDALVLKYEDEENLDLNQIINYVPLKEYEEYSVLTRSLELLYVLTLKPEVVVKKGAYGTIDGSIATRQATLNYTISNADTSIYLDAIEVLKENAMPKVEYDVKPNVFATEYCETLYNKLGNIIRINDNELKFKNIRGYISGLTLDLDNPDEDTIEVKNYKTKFEDLFSTITAQTEAMKKNNGLMLSVAAAFTSSGELSETVLQSSIRKVDLDYAFNNGKLTIDEHNGIWGTSDTGVVAFRGGGIFTATEKNTLGNWKWNTGITPEGINADLITTGQLDTNLIKIYSGDNLRFQMNGDGIFAYKSKTTYIDKPSQAEGTDLRPDGKETVSAQESIDNLQYVRFCDEGLMLVAKQGAKVLNNTKSGYITVLEGQYRPGNEIKRVEIGWRGLILRNWKDEEVFYADADTGNLTLTGRIIATSGKIGAWNIDNNKIWADSAANDETYTTFVALNAGGTSNDALVKSDGTAYLDNNNNELRVSTKDYAFWAGSPNPAEAKFSIKKDGTLKATAGQIGGWNLSPDLLYNINSLILAPGAQGGGTTTIRVPQQKVNEKGELLWDKNGDPEYLTEKDGTIKYIEKTVSYQDTILWVPSAAKRAEYQEEKLTIIETLHDAVFTISKDGDLTATSVNGWIKTAFTADQAPRIIIGASQTGLTMRNLITGKPSYVNFNTLSSATASWSIGATGRTSYGGNKTDTINATRYLSVTCKVTAGTKTKEFTQSIPIHVSIHRSGTDGASATVYYGLSWSQITGTGKLTIK